MTEEAIDSRFGDERFGCYPEWWAMSDIIPGSQLKTLLAYNVHADFYTGENAWPSKQKIAEAIGLDVRTVRMHCRDLENIGLLVAREQRAGDTTIYAVNRQMTEDQARARLLELNENLQETSKKCAAPERSIRSSEDSMYEPQIERVTPETDVLGVGNDLPPYPGNEHPGTPETDFRQPYSPPETIEPETLPVTRALSRAPCSAKDKAFKDDEIQSQVEIEVARIPKRHRSEYRAMASRFYEIVGQMPPHHRVKATEILRRHLNEEPPNWRALKGFLQSIIKCDGLGGSGEILKFLRQHGRASNAGAVPPHPLNAKAASSLHMEHPEILEGHGAGIAE